MVWKIVVITENNREQGRLPDSNTSEWTPAGRRRVESSTGGRLQRLFSRNGSPAGSGRARRIAGGRLQESFPRHRVTKTRCNKAGAHTTTRMVAPDKIFETTKVTKDHNLLGFQQTQRVASSSMESRGESNCLGGNIDLGLLSQIMER